MAPKPPTLGTAPRRVSAGVWKTRKGESLTPAQAKVWENYYRTGRTDGKGHFTQSGIGAGVGGKATVPKPKPARGPGAAALNRAAAREAAGIHSSFTGGLGEALRQAGHAALPGTPLLPIIAAVHHPSPRSVGSAVLHANPVLGPMFDTGVQTDRAALGAAQRVRSGQVPSVGQGLALAGLFPGFRGGKAARAALEADQAAKVVPEVAAATPEEKVMAAMPAAREAMTAQKAVNAAERARRLELYQKAFHENGMGQEGHIAGLRALQGEFEKVPFNDLASLTPAEYNHLVNSVETNPLIHDWEVLNVRQALDKARRGLPLQEAEIEKVARAFGPDKAVELATPTFGEKATKVVADILNIPRSLLASFDVSAPLRQGLVALFMNPRAWGRAQGPMFRALLKEGNATKLEQIRESDPVFPAARDSGLAVTDMENILHGEERFSSRAAEKITGLGILWGKPGTASFVRASGRAYTEFLNNVRFELWKGLVEDMGGVGQVTEKQMRGAAEVANWATGRGSVHGLEKSAALLNAAFFSPRLTFSRIKAFDPTFYYHLYKTDPVLAKAALGATMKMVATGSMLLGAAAWAGAKVGTDPRSADFGKLRIGNTRFDVWGGHQQFARLLSQIATGQVVSSTDGTLVIHGGWGGRGSAKVIGRFVRGKLNPTTSFAVDWFMNSDYAGQPLSWKKEAVGHMIPLLLQDVWDLAHKPGSPWWDLSGKPIQGVGAGALGAFGVGIQTYGPNKKSSTRSVPYHDPFSALDTGGGGYSDPFSNLGP